MPQLDLFSFLTQVFWCCFFFCGLYVTLSKDFLPLVYQSLKLRQIFTASCVLSETENSGPDLSKFGNVRGSFSSTISNAKSVLLKRTQKTANWSSKYTVIVDDEYLFAQHAKINYLFSNKATFPQKLVSYLVASNLNFVDLDKSLMNKNKVSIKEEFFNMGSGYLIAKVFGCAVIRCPYGGEDF
jgi:hypothetical protein